jgi:putative ABC transport system permease protein
VNGFGAVRTATGGIGRHKVQAVVLVIVLAVATASALLGMALLNGNDAPFDRSFAAQNGASVTVTANAARATATELAATSHASGVTAAAGPFGQATVQTTFLGQPNGQLSLVGRSGPGGPVDDLSLTNGHWADEPGQIVLNGQPGDGTLNAGPDLGSVIDVTGTSVRLTVVGFATSITNTADGWVAPAEIASLGGPPTAEMLYRFTSAGNYAQIRTDVAAVSKLLPAGSVEGSGSWLQAQVQAEGNGAIMEPFVVAFAVIGLAMAVLIVGNVVSGAVISSYRRIGVLKSVGMTPAQVVATYLSRIGWPALIGCMIGAVLGNLLATSVLSQQAAANGASGGTAPWWATAGAVLGMFALTMLAAFGPALRAGRLSATQAIAAGRAPRTGHGYAAHRLAAKLRLPRPVGLGLAAPFARPARTMVTLLAVVFGATAVIFAVGLHWSLDRAAASQSLAAAVPVSVQQDGPGAGPNQEPSAAQDAAVTAALTAQPGTARVLPVYENPVKVVGISQQTDATVFGGDSSWLGYGIIAGHWLDGPGQVDVNTAFLDQSGLSIGDTAVVTLPSTTGGTSQVTVRIVGEIFRPSSDPHIFASAQTLPGVATVANLDQYDVGLKPGTNATAYIQAINAKLGVNGPWGADPPQHGQFYTIASELIGLLALMVAIAAGLGVLNTVLMTTRDRVHDLGVYKALGMRPAQMIVMVICWIAGPAIVAAVIAAPAAILLNTATLHAMASTAHTGVPASFTQVFGAARLAVLALAALVIAVAGAFLPASWAAAARPAVALRAE